MIWKGKRERMGKAEAVVFWTDWKYVWVWLHINYRKNGIIVL